MKKAYHKPETTIVPLPGPMLMLEGSTTVRGYTRGDDIMVGDVDE